MPAPQRLSYPLNHFVTLRVSVYKDEGVGIERNSFKPANDRPFVDDAVLMDLGYYEKTDWYLRGIRF